MTRTAPSARGTDVVLGGVDLDGDVNLDVLMDDNGGVDVHIAVKVNDDGEVND